MNPDDLLQQIQQLLQQYLSLGADTPVAAEAQALDHAIAQTMGDAGLQPGAGGDPQIPPDASAPVPGGGAGPAMPPDMASGKPNDFAGARKAAMQDMADGGPASKAAAQKQADTKKKRMAKA